MHNTDFSGQILSDGLIGFLIELAYTQLSGARLARSRGQDWIAHIVFISRPQRAIQEIITFNA